MQVGVVAPGLNPQKPPAKLGNVGDAVAEIGHAPSMGMFYILCKGHADGFCSPTHDDCNMDEIWPKRENFRRHVKKYRLDKKCRLKEVAVALGIEEPTLKDYLYRKNVKPSIGVMQLAAKVFECSVLEFVDDPGHEPAGQDLSYLSDQARFFSELIVKDMAAEDLSDEDRRFLYEDFRLSLGRLKTIRTRMAGRAEPTGQDHFGAKPEDGNPAGPRPLRVPHKRR